MKKQKKQNLIRMLSVLLLIVTLVPTISIVSKAAVLYVNGSTFVSYNILEGYSGGGNTWIYSIGLDNGENRLAYCVNPSLAGPQKNQNNTTVGLVKVTEANPNGYDWAALCKVAKVISYGYHGDESDLYKKPPCADLTLKYWDESDAAMRYLATHIAAGYAMTGS